MQREDQQSLDHHKGWIIPILIFSFGLVFGLFLLTTSSGPHLFRYIANNGFSGIGVAGAMYSFSFTATSATIIFSELPSSVNPFFAAIVGAFGALIYDTIIFSFSRFESHQHWSMKIRDAMQHKKHLPKWLLIIVGGIILASPLPDELAAGTLGLSAISGRYFLLFSFLLNALGIYIVIMLGGS